MFCFHIIPFSNSDIYETGVSEGFPHSLGPNDHHVPLSIETRTWYGTSYSRISTIKSLACIFPLGRCSLIISSSKRSKPVVALWGNMVSTGTPHELMKKRRKQTWSFRRMHPSHSHFSCFSQPMGAEFGGPQADWAHWQSSI